jgi:Lon protease-like protein
MEEKDPQKYHGRKSSSLSPLGVFPLEIVVFPGSYVPLYIFEERYKSLIKDSIENDLPFGINYTTGNQIHDWGCIVRVAEVVKVHEKGEMNIVAVGSERACLREMVDGQKEYLTGLYERYIPEEKDFTPAILLEVVDLFNQIIGTAESPLLAQLDFDEMSRLINPSYYIAQKAGLSIQERQEILALAYENDRLTVILNHLKGVLPLTSKADLIQKVIKNNGYIGPHSFGM